MTKPLALNPRQMKFVLAYLVEPNATKAAIAAGYSAKGADVQGARVLGNVSVAAEIARRQSRVAAKAEVTVDWIIERYKRIADADIRRFYDENGNLKPIHELDDASAATLAGVETEEEYQDGAVVSRVRKIKRWDPTKALDSLARHLGMFIDRQEVTHKHTLEVLVNASQEPVTIEGGANAA